MYTVSSIFGRDGGGGGGGGATSSFFTISSIVDTECAGPDTTRTLSVVSDLTATPPTATSSASPLTLTCWTGITFCTNGSRSGGFSFAHAALAIANNVHE